LAILLALYTWPEGKPAAELRALAPLLNRPKEEVKQELQLLEELGFIASDVHIDAYHVKLSAAGWKFMHLRWRR
jgi:DNA-binding IclR family transcriptional regulator